MLALFLNESGSRIPASLEPVREHSSVQGHANYIVMFDPVIEDALHQAVGAER